MWMSDVMHGPKVRHGRTRSMTYVMAFGGDEATKVVAFAAVAMTQNTSVVLPVFMHSPDPARPARNASMGINGVGDRSRHLALVCAQCSAWL